MTRFIKTYAVQIFIIVTALVLIATAVSTVSKNSSANLEYSDLYEKNITLGDIELHLIVRVVTVRDERGYDWLGGEYQFYSTNRHPKLLATVASLVPPAYNVHTGIDPFFSLKDITGDGIPEILITEERGSQVTSYRILQWDNGALVPIHHEGSDSVIFDTIEYADGYVYLTWHGSQEAGKAKYRLDAHYLYYIYTVIFKWDLDTADENDCSVIVGSPGDGPSLIEHKADCSIWTDSFDSYFDVTERTRSI